MNLRIVLSALALLCAPHASPAQPTYLDLTIDDVGIAIGDAPASPDCASTFAIAISSV